MQGHARAADESADPQRDQLVQHQQHQHGEGLLQDREQPHALMELDGEERDDGECQRMLSEYRAGQQVDQQAGEPAAADADPFRHCHAPVDQHQADPVRAQVTRPFGQRHDGQQQGDNEREHDGATTVMPCQRHSVSSARDGTAGVAAVAGAGVSAAVAASGAAPAGGVCVRWCIRGRRRVRASCSRRRRFIRGGKDGGLARPYQQHLAAAIEFGKRGGGDLREGMPGIVLHGRDLGHRVARREVAAQPGGDQQVAGLNVRVVRYVGQFQAVDGAGTDGDGAQPVAIDLHRDGMRGVGDQHGRGGIGTGVHDLTHDALGVEQRLAGVDAVDFALVDHDLVFVRVEIDRQQFGDQHLFADLERGIEQFPQADVFRLQRRQLLQLHLLHHLLGAQAFVILLQAAARGQGFAEPVRQGAGRVHGELDGVDQDGQAGAQRFQALVLVVHHHQYHGQYRKQDQPRGDGWALCEDELDRAPLKSAMRRHCAFTFSPSGNAPCVALPPTSLSASLRERVGERGA